MTGPGAGNGHAPADDQPPAELVYPETVTKEALRDLFVAAYMDASLDEDGDVMVREGYRSYLIPSQDGAWIRIYSPFKGLDTASLEDKLAYVNKVNSDLIIVRAYVTDKGGFIFEEYLPVEGGITKRALVLAVRRFHRMLESAIRADEKNVLG
jgi:hypothetical protein